MTDETIARKLAETLERFNEKRRCYCPSDCNCHHQGPPFNRPNYCGCQEH